MHESTDWNQRYRDGHGGGEVDPALELDGIVERFGATRGLVLDVGCGAGADAVYLANRGFDVIGVDVSSEALARAAERAEAHGVSVTWHHGSALELPAETGSVTAVLDRGCLHHVPAADQPRYAAELARVLAPSGRAFFRDRAHGAGDAQGHAHAHSHGHAHPAIVSTEGLTAFVDGVPLEVETVEPFELQSPRGAIPAVLGALRRTDG